MILDKLKAAARNCVNTAVEFDKCMEQCKNHELSKYQEPEIPEDIPASEYLSYLLANFKDDTLQKPTSEWTDSDRHKHASRQLRLIQASAIEDLLRHNKPLNNRDRRMVERVRKGVDFNLHGKEAAIVTENPARYTYRYLNEWQEEHFKTHPEDKDKSWEELADIRNSEKQLHHYEFINGKYYGAEIPKEIPYPEYIRYLECNITYVHHSIFDKKSEMEIFEGRLHHDRLLVAIIISDWNPETLNDWQREIIEQVRVGIELEDAVIVKAMDY